MQIFDNTTDLQTIFLLLQEMFQNRNSNIELIIAIYAKRENKLGILESNFAYYNFFFNSFQSFLNSLKIKSILCIDKVEDIAIRVFEPCNLHLTVNMDISI